LKVKRKVKLVKTKRDGRRNTEQYNCKNLKVAINIVSFQLQKLTDRKRLITHMAYGGNYFIQAANLRPTYWLLITRTRPVATFKSYNSFYDFYIDTSTKWTDWLKYLQWTTIGPALASSGCASSERWRNRNISDVVLGTPWSGQARYWNWYIVLGG